MMKRYKIKRNFLTKVQQGNTLVFVPGSGWRQRRRRQTDDVEFTEQVDVFLGKKKRRQVFVRVQALSVYCTKYIVSEVKYKGKPINKALIAVITDRPPCAVPYHRRCRCRRHRHHSHTTVIKQEGRERIRESERPAVPNGLS